MSAMAAAMLNLFTFLCLWSKIEILSSQPEMGSVNLSLQIPEADDRGVRETVQQNRANLRTNYSH